MVSQRPFVYAFDSGFSMSAILPVMTHGQYDSILPSCCDVSRVLFLSYRILRTEYGVQSTGYGVCTPQYLPR